MIDKDLKYLLALRFTQGIGRATARRLLQLFPNPEDIFTLDRKAFLNYDGMGERLYKALRKNVDWNAVEHEVDFIKKNGIKYCSVIDPKYPQTLLSCNDAPFMLFYKGVLNLEKRKTVSIVGTRSATGYGQAICTDLVSSLKPYDPVIISGLAYGIDIASHLAALNNELTTIAVVAHGLNIIYPSLHRKHAYNIIESGGCVLTEFTSLDKADKENFPLRNRIIAGLSEATVVVEASAKGGALITARLANGYNREVFAFPGRINDVYSSGCNLLIKNNEAALIGSGQDLIHALGWDQVAASHIPTQKKLFPEVDEDELKIVKTLEKMGKASIDDLSNSLEFSASRLATLLLTLEMKGAVAALPGKMYLLS